MSLQNGTWVDIKKGEIKMENKEVKKYTVITSINCSKKFIFFFEFLP